MMFYLNFNFVLVNFFRIQRSIFPLDSAYSVEPPKVNSRSRDIYASYIKHGQKGGDPPSNRDLNTYQQYLWNKYL